MKYAIYDKAANGYLTKMEFEVGYSERTQFECGLNEYITEAKLLDTPKEAADAIVRIESFKFMDKGRFVMHSFDNTLKDQYIISEAGNPTKVVDNITVDLDGTIDVKYGTMAFHWSTLSLEYAINRMNALQKAKSSRYTSWCNTFDVYRVITVIDEKSCTHYQFIKVTEKGLTEYAKNEVDPLNKRIEELEKANQVLTDNVNYHNECRLALAEIIRAIKYAIYYYKDSEKRDNYISYMTDRIKDDEIFNRPELKTAKNDIPKLCKHLTALVKNPLNKRIEELEKANYELGEQVAERGIVANRLLDENNNLKTKVEAIKKEARNWKYLYEKADKDREALTNVIDNIYDDLGSTDICKDLKVTYDYVEELSELNYIKIHNDDLEDFAAEIVEWKNKARKAEKALEDQKKLNDANKATIAYLTINKMAKDKELSDLKRRAEEAIRDYKNCNKENHELRVARDCSAEIIYAIRNAIVNGDTNAFDCIESRMRHDPDFKSDPFMAGVRENVKDICYHEKINITNNDLKNSEIARLTEERDKALEQKEFYKRQANSVYGMTVPTRCCGKQVTADILSGKKIPVDKKKYDDLVEYVSSINLTYDAMFCMMDKPVYLSTITESLNDLTK